MKTKNLKAFYFATWIEDGEYSSRLYATNYEDILFFHVGEDTWTDSSFPNLEMLYKDAEEVRKVSEKEVASLIYMKELIE